MQSKGFPFHDRSWLDFNLERESICTPKIEDNMKITNVTLEIIKQRRSIRAYQETQIHPEQLNTILGAGSYAPNAGGQAWHFTAVQNKKILTRLNNAAKETAQQLQLPGLADLANDENFDCLYGAPTLIIVSGWDASPIPLEIDCAAATENMLLAAQSMGLGSCWIYFVLLAFNSEKADELRNILKIPQNYKPYTSAVFGIPAEKIVEIPERKPNLITMIP
jgi:nitroreductase